MMDITKREIVASITIIAVWLCLGFFLSEKVDTWQQDKNAEYDKAARIEQQDLFEHGMNTNLGNAFVYGELQAKEPVSYPGIAGMYSYIEEVKERYTMHTRTVTYTTGSGKNRQTHTRVETYWTWDVVDRQNQKVDTVIFLGNEFKSDLINLPDAEYIDMIQESSHVRFRYYGVPEKMSGTLYSKLENGSICDGSHYYADKTISETVEMLEKEGAVAIFWILWIALMFLLVFVFYHMENWWLNQ